MPDLSKLDDFIIEKSASGTDDQDQLNALIAEAWRAALSNALERAAVAALLGAEEAELDPATPPFRAEVRGSGTFSAEVLIALSAGFVLGFAKDFGKSIGSEAGKKAAQILRDLWTDHLRNRVSPPGSSRLGPEKENIDKG